MCGSLRQVTKPEHIIASDVYQPSLDRLKTSGIRTSQDNMEVCMCACSSH